MIAESGSTAIVKLTFSLPAANHVIGVGDVTRSSGASSTLHEQHDREHRGRRARDDRAASARQLLEQRLRRTARARTAADERQREDERAPGRSGQTRAASSAVGCGPRARPACSVGSSARPPASAAARRPSAGGTPSFAQRPASRDASSDLPRR